MTTLGYVPNNDAILKIVSKNSSSPEDRRGKYLRNTIDKNIIMEHIKSFNPCISHYRREHAPNKLYLPSDVTIVKMFENFQKQHSQVKCSYDFYRKIVSEDMNISFTQLGHEECEKCESFSLNHSHNKDQLQEGCEYCVNYKNHIEKANNSRKEYRKDVNAAMENIKFKITDEIFYSAELQKVIMLPRLDTFKEVIFTPRLIVFNESFVPLGKMCPQSVNFACLWHEAIAGRKKKILLVAFTHFLCFVATKEKLLFGLIIVAVKIKIGLCLVT